MYYGRKKAIIIIAIVVTLIILLVAGGVFAYLKTDMFKANDDLFFKYIGKSLENLNYVENTQLKDISKLKEQMPYTLNGEVTLDVGQDNLDGIYKILSDMKITVESKVNNSEEKTYTKTQLLNNGQNLFTLEYANSNNIYALKSDEVATAYLGIEDNNLNALFQKLNIPYDILEMIPNKMGEVNLNELSNISEEEMSHIREIYIPVIKENIPKEAYSKDSNIAVLKDGITYNATGYRLKLTEEQLRQLKIAILQTLKEDSITLNLITTKAKLLGLDENYTQINRLTDQIQNEINTIENSSYAQGEISIVVYVENGEVITTEILSQDVKYTIYANKNGGNITRYLLIEQLDVTEKYNKIEIKLDETISSMQSTINILINVDDEFNISIYLDNTGTAQEQYLNTNAEVTLSQEDKSYTLTYTQNLNFKEDIGDIIELNRNNCGVLNDYTEEQLQYLIQSITYRLQEILQQKLQILGL